MSYSDSSLLPSCNDVAIGSWHAVVDFCAENHDHHVAPCANMPQHTLPSVQIKVDIHNVTVASYAFDASDVVLAQGLGRV
jgi:hypothetical protein